MTMGADRPLNLILLGCGKMGGALLERWLDSDLDLNITVIDPAYTPPSSEVQSVKSYRDCEEEIKQADIIVLAVKPQIMQAACAPIAPLIPKTSLILSIAAGRSIARIEAIFGADQPIIRTMPNTPASIGKGATVGTANPKASLAQKDIAEHLLSLTGLFEWVEDESLMNAVTALSGSGPAYIFYLIETLTQAGIDTGLSPALSEALARQTVIGSAALAETEPETPAAALRENVTSPAGTTAAALEILMNGEMEAIFKKALQAAKARGEELDD